MSNNEKYPEWGAFGTALEDAVLKEKTRISSDIDGSTWELIVKIGDIVIETVPTDKPEQIVAAMQKASELDTLRTKAKRERLRLVQSDHPLKDFIEEAIARVGATSFDKPEAVWRQLVEMSEESSAPSHVLGFSPAQQAIKYHGKKYDKSGVSDFLTRDALAQLFRRQKAHADQRQSTRTDAE